MKKKLILLYIALFTIFFITSLLINSFYKSYIKEYKPNHQYNVSGLQYYDLKNKLSEKILKRYLLDRDIKFAIKSKKIEDNSLTYDTARSNIYFELYLSDYIEEKELENGINDIYLGSINLVVNDLEDLEKLYNYESIKEQYKKIKKNDATNAYNALISSEFFKKYPPKISCPLNDKLTCYNYLSLNYSLIYSTIKQNFSNQTFNSFLNLDVEIKQESVATILYDFHNNKYLFQNKNYINNNEEYNSFTYDKLEQFYSKKYRELLESDIYFKYLPAFYCKIDAEACLIKISNHLGLLLYKNKIESKHPFKVEHVPTKSKIINNLSEIIINFAISILFIYFLFMYANKFFIKKLR
tara:strand:- start:7152 stop:8213 length:1062 start_codon:yes stop_codon:yes gene_type:complete